MILPKVGFNPSVKELMSQNRTRWELRLEQLERQLRAGQLESARHALMAPDLAKAPRPFVARLANLARRAQRPSLSLRLLQPLVRPMVVGLTQVEPEELLEYAYALQKVGARNQSLSILENLAESHAKAHLAIAFHHFYEWDYANALGRLERITEEATFSPYERLVVQVNRLACLVALKDDRAENEFVEIERQLVQEGSPILAANVLEIMAQSRIEVGRVSEARVFLSRAKKLLPESESLYRLMIEKWDVIACAVETGDPEGVLQFRNRALEMKHWETLRDLDYVLAKLDPSSRWAEWVYYGTPYAGFRQKLEGLRIFPESSWVSRDARPDLRWDPWFPEGGDGDLMHRFVASLASDFYRPYRIGEIFSNLFPDQYYDIEVSPNRVHQIASRARAWLKEKRVPARLEEDAGSYCLRWRDNVAIRARSNSVRFTKVEFLFERFRNPRPLALSAREWAEHLGFSQEKVKRLLREARSSGLVKVERKGQYSRYVLKPVAA